jgi:hypothetical protein
MRMHGNLRTSAFRRFPGGGSAWLGGTPIATLPLTLLRSVSADAACAPMIVTSRPLPAILKPASGCGGHKAETTSWNAYSRRESEPPKAPGRSHKCGGETPESRYCPRPHLHGCGQRHGTGPGTGLQKTRAAQIVRKALSPGAALTRCRLKVADAEKRGAGGTDGAQSADVGKRVPGTSCKVPSRWPYRQRDGRRQNRRRTASPTWGQYAFGHPFRSGSGSEKGQGVLPLT